MWKNIETQVMDTTGMVLTIVDIRMIHIARLEVVVDEVEVEGMIAAMAQGPSPTAIGMEETGLTTIVKIGAQKVVEESNDCDGI
jgi:hypothetical protein